MRLIVKGVILSVLAVVAVACTVRYSFSGASVSQGASMYSVSYFDNRASMVQPTLSQDITDALIDKVKLQTKLKNTANIDEADMSFSGEITTYSTVPLTASANDEAATNRFTITVRVIFENFIEPDKNFDKSFSRYEDYSGNLDFSSVESELSASIVKLLIEDIFNEAFVTW